MTIFFGIELDNASKNAALRDYVTKLPNHVQRVIALATLRMGEFIASRAVANAPIRPDPVGGALRASIRPSPVKSDADGFLVLVVADESYALRMHEELTPVGPLQLGPESRRQPGTSEGGVGGRYLARAAELNVERLNNILKEAVENNLPNVGTVSVRAIPGATSPGVGAPLGRVPNFLFPS